MDHTTAVVGRIPREPERRSFLVRAATIVIGGILVLFPFAAGVGVLFTPLRRRGLKDAVGEAAELVRICPLEALPADGVPHEFAVTAAMVDAWTRTPSHRVGAVFLVRTDSQLKPQVTAFTATCPHLGCSIEFDASDKRFECPCHESGFALNGKKLFGPSERGLDPLEVRLVEDDGQQHVWVRFQRFRTGIAERIPVA